MNISDIIGLIIIVSIILLHLFFKVDTRWLIIASILALLTSAGFLITYSTANANAAGTVAYYCLAAEVILILLGKFVQKIRGEREDEYEKKVSMFGTIPDRIKKVRDRRGGGNGRKKIGL